MPPEKMYSRGELAELVRKRNPQFKGVEDEAVVEIALLKRPDLRARISTEPAPAPAPQPKSTITSMKELAQRAMRRLRPEPAPRVEALEMKPQDAPALREPGMEPSIMRAAESRRRALLAPRSAQVVQMPDVRDMEPAPPPAGEPPIMTARLQPGSVETLQRMEEPEAARQLAAAQKPVREALAYRPPPLQKLGEKILEHSRSLEQVNPTASPLAMAQETLSGLNRLVGSAVKGATVLDLGLVFGPLVVKEASEAIKATNWFRKLSVPERQVVVSRFPALDLPDAELMEIFRTSPEGVQKAMAVYNPKVRQILQTGRSAPPAAPPAAPRPMPRAAAPAAPPAPVVPPQAPIVPPAVPVVTPVAPIVPPPPAAVSPTAPAAAATKEYSVTPTPARVKIEMDPIKAIAPAVNQDRKDVARSFLNYVYGDVKNKVYVATDGRILTVLPAKDVKQGFWVARPDKKSMEVAGAKKEGDKRFPPWEKIVPKDADMSFLAAPADLYERVSSVAAASKKLDSKIPARLTISGKDYYVDPALMKRAIEPLLAQGFKKLTIGVISPNSPIKIKTEGGAFSVVMPMRGEPERFATVFTEAKAPTARPADWETRARVLREELAAVREQRPARTGEAMAMAEAPSLGEVPAAVQPITADPQFKLWRSTEELIQKYAGRYGEGKYRPPGAVGVFYPDTTNIVLQGANNVYVAVHEITHFLDRKKKWAKKALDITGYTGSGRPIYSKKGAPLRNDLREFYLAHYPRASAGAPLRTQVKEGLATLIMKAVESPAVIDNPRWALLRKEVLEPGGKLYEPEFEELIKDGRQKMAKFYALDPLGQMKARIADTSTRLEKKLFFNGKHEVMQVLTDAFYKVDTLAKTTGFKWTDMDPYVALQSFRVWSAVANNNISDATRGLFIMRDGDIRQVSDRNIKNLFNMLESSGYAENFNAFLIARDMEAGYRRLDQFRTDLIQLTDGTYDPTIGKTAALKEWLTQRATQLEPREYRSLIRKIRAAMKDYSELSGIIQRNDIPRPVVEAVLNQGQADEKIVAAADLYDEINKFNLEMIRDAGWLTPERYAALAANVNYASLKRDIQTLITDDAYPAELRMGTGGAQPAPLKRRTGGQQAFKGPLYSLVIDHAEIMRKAMRQDAVNKIYKMVSAQPEVVKDIFQRVQLQTAVDKRGVVSYPQAKDPNVYMAWEAGRPMPLQVLDKGLKTVLDNTMMSPGSVGLFDRILTKTAGIFTKGTTALYLQFILANIPIDQVSATAQAQTQAAYKPLYDQLKLIRQALADNNSPVARYFKEYLVMGGERQTLARWLDQNASPAELYRRSVGEATRIERALGGVDKILNIMSIPSQYSEIMSRLTEYIKARQEGRSALAAFEMAGQITGSWHHLGTWGGQTGRTWVKSIAFFNPAVQVLAQQIRAVTDKATRNRAWFTWLALTSAMVATELNMWDTASDEQKANYRNLPVGVKGTYIWLPDPTAEGRVNGRLWKMKVPENYSFVGHVINMIISDLMYQTRYDPGDYVQAATQALPEQLNPLERQRMFFSWWPQLFRPAFEVAAGKRTFPKVMDLTPAQLSRLPTEMRYTDRTSPLAVKAAKLRAAILLDLSPIEIDHLIEGYLGRTAKFFTGRYGGMTNPLWNDLTLNSMRAMEFFYEVREQTRQQAAAMKARQEAGELVELSAEESVDFGRRLAGIEEIDERLSYYRRLMKIKDPTPELEQQQRYQRDQLLNRLDSFWTEQTDLKNAAPPSE